MGIFDALLAGVGGAAKGVESQQRFDKAEELKRQLAQQQEELRVMLAKISDSTKQRGQDLTDAQKAADRNAKADQVAANLNHLYSKDADANSLAWDSHNILRGNEKGRNDRFTAGLNEKSGEYWGGTLPLAYTGLDVKERGQNATDARAAAGRASAERIAAGVQGGANARAAAGQAATDNRSRANVAVRLAEMARRNAAGLGDADTDFADEFEKNYQSLGVLGPSAGRALVPPEPTDQNATDGGVAPDPSAAPLPVPVGAAPAPSAPPSAAPPRGRVPVQGRPQAGAPPAAAEVQAAQLVAEIRRVESAGGDASAQRTQLAALRRQALGR